MASTPEIPTLHLRRGSAKPIHAGHPWVFAGAIERFSGGAPEPGAEVRVCDADRQVLGHGYFSPGSAIAVRLLTRGDEPADEALLARRIDAALALRRDVLKLGGADGTTTAYRLIHSEGDGLGGLTVDVYGDCLCVQIGSAGMERRRDALARLLEERLHPRAILDRGDPRARKREHLAPPESGTWRGQAPAAPYDVFEHGLPLVVDPRPGAGQKTGLFLDQRENRRRFAEFARGREVLDLFSYSGAFALHAARAGARSLTLADSSAAALNLAKANLERNAISDADLICADWPIALQHLRESGRCFGLVAIDPPKFAPDKQSVEPALQGYRELNAQAARSIGPGGILFTCSCSGNVSETEFERAVASGLAHAGRRATLLERHGAGPDHPMPPGFEQGHYLKCLVLQLE